MSRTEQLSDFDERAVSAAEADLERLLSIEPSPEFIAKLRARIAAEPPVRTWRWGRLGLALAAASALIVVFALRGGQAVRDDGPRASNPPHEDVVLSIDPTNSPQVVVAVAPAADLGPQVRRATALPQREPEIIIDPAVTDAIRRLAIAARSTSLDASKGESIAADAQAAALPVAELLNVPELVLKPADQTRGQ